MSIKNFKGTNDMLKDLYEKYYYDMNYNCAETLIRVSFGGFGAGIQTGNTWSSGI